MLFFGEFCVIFSEMIGARSYSNGSTFIQAFLYALPFLVVGATLLLVSYMLGLKHFANIWVVSAISLGSILTVEPLFDYFYIGHVPTFGAGVGFAFGVLGILASLFL